MMTAAEEPSPEDEIHPDHFRDAFPDSVMHSPLLQGGTTGAKLGGLTLFRLFHCLSDSTGAGGNQAELAEHLENMVNSSITRRQPYQASRPLCHPIHAFHQIPEDKFRK